MKYYVFLVLLCATAPSLHAMDHCDAPKILNKNRLNQNLRAFIERLPNGEIHWVTLQMYDNDGNPTKKDRSNFMYKTYWVNNRFQIRHIDADQFIYDDEEIGHDRIHTNGIVVRIDSDDDLGMRE